MKNKLIVCSLLLFSALNLSASGSELTKIKDNFYIDCQKILAIKKRGLSIIISTTPQSYIDNRAQTIHYTPEAWQNLLKCIKGSSNE